jgi:hypothetical protein
MWRRNRDSNPGRTFTLVGFQDRCIRPLCHSSDKHFLVWVKKFRKPTFEENCACEI